MIPKTSMNDFNSKTPLLEEGGKTAPESVRVESVSRRVFKALGLCFVAMCALSGAFRAGMSWEREAGLSTTGHPHLAYQVRKVCDEAAVVNITEQLIPKNYSCAYEERANLISITYLDYPPIELYEKFLCCEPDASPSHRSKISHPHKHLPVGCTAFKALIPLSGVNQGAPYEFENQFLVSSDKQENDENQC